MEAVVDGEEGADSRAHGQREDHDQGLFPLQRAGEADEDHAQGQGLHDPLLELWGDALVKQ